MARLWERDFRGAAIASFARNASFRNAFELIPDCSFASFDTARCPETLRSREPRKEHVYSGSTNCNGREFLVRQALNDPRDKVLMTSLPRSFERTKGKTAHRIESLRDDRPRKNFTERRRDERKGAVKVGSRYCEQFARVFNYGPSNPQFPLSSLIYGYKLIL